MSYIKTSNFALNDHCFLHDDVVDRYSLYDDSIVEQDITSPIEVSGHIQF